MEQEFTSKDTSMNVVNKIYKELNMLGLKEGATILDWGCGKYETMQRIAEEKGYNWYGYDPFNRTYFGNFKALSEYQMKYPDLIICSNVLNVIKEDEILIDMMKSISQFMSDTTQAVFTIYEGNKSGIGEQTTRGYQRNQRTKDYVDMLWEFFRVHKASGNVIFTKRKGE